MKLLIVALLFLSTQIYAQKKFLFLGDSLTAGYGVSKENSYPQLLKGLVKEKLQKEIIVINGSVSGSTTASSLSRLKWYLRSKPDYLFLALGANDGLRGLKVQDSKVNLEKTIKLAIENKIKVVMLGMQMPPNYGKTYRNEFKSMYEQIYKKYDLKFVPFILDGVGGHKEFNQADGIHPNENGHKKIAKNLFPVIKELL